MTETVSGPAGAADLRLEQQLMSTYEYFPMSLHHR